MDTAYFFSDETGQHTGGRYFLIAGAAFAHYRLWIRDELGRAERVSGKEKKDWNGTKNLAQRIRYIEEALAIGNLQGTVFYAAYPNNKREYWDHTVDALTLAINRFGAGRHSIIRHQGFNYRTREKLTAELQLSGHSFELQSGNQQKHAEMRLADALSGYIALTKFGSEGAAGRYPDLPGWFINLKNEAPQDLPCGASQSP